MELALRIKEIAETMLEEGQFLVNISVSGISGPQKATISLDGDKGVTIDDCASLSRKLSDSMEEQGLIGDNFTLEVTTPGVEKPLLLKRQYVRNVGRVLKVTKKDKSVVEGKLTEVKEDTITIEQEIGEKKKKELKAVVIAFADIEKTLVQISFK